MHWLGCSVYFLIEGVGMKPSAQKDHPKKMLDLQGSSVPMDFCKYSLASMLIEICNTKEPKKDHQSLVANKYRCRRRPSTLRVFDNSKKKIGKQMLRNRIDDIAARLPACWETLDVKNKHKLRKELKKSFLK